MLSRKSSSAAKVLYTLTEGKKPHPESDHGVEDVLSMYVPQDKSGNRELK